MVITLGGKKESKKNREGREREEEDSSGEPSLGAVLGSVHREHSAFEAAVDR